MSGLLEVQAAGDITVVKFTTPKLDDSNAHAIGQELDALVDQPTLHLDMGDVQFIGGMGLGKLVGLHRKVKVAGGQLRLFNVDGLVGEAFQVTKLNTLMDVRQKAVLA